MMNNKELGDVSDMNVGESIKEKLLRLNSERTGAAIWRNDVYCEFSFDVVCKLLDMAITEEREVCASWVEEELSGEYSNFGLPASIRNGEHIATPKDEATNET